jgi:GST-like protein
MIDLYYWPTPNGHKITMFLEEAGLDYRIRPVDIGAGEQFEPEFLAISPNNRMPAIVDQAPADGGEPVSVFESGTILLYLAEKTGKFLPTDLRGRKTVLEWLFWQVGGLGPMAGQNHHFVQYAPEKLSYAIDRYVNETNRLYGVLDRRLHGRAFIAGDYTIADMACYPWIVAWKKQLQNLDDFPDLRRWFDAIRERPATIRAYETIRAYDKGKPWSDRPVVNEDSRGILFGQRALEFAGETGCRGRAAAFGMTGIGDDGTLLRGLCRRTALRDRHIHPPGRNIVRVCPTVRPATVPLGRRGRCAERVPRPRRERLAHCRADHEAAGGERPHCGWHHRPRDRDPRMAAAGPGG